MPVKLSENEAGISNQVVALILVAAAVVGGAFAYTAFRNQAQSATGGKHVRVQSLDLTVVPPNSLFSITVKNTGTESLDNVEAKLITSSGSWTVGSPPLFRGRGGLEPDGKYIGGSRHHAGLRKSVGHLNSKLPAEH